METGGGFFAEEYLSSPQPLQMTEVILNYSLSLLTFLPLTHLSGSTWLRKERRTGHQMTGIP